MTAIAQCDHCHATFQVKDRLVGKGVRCPVCSETFRVRPAAHVGGAVKVAQDQLDQKVKIPKPSKKERHKDDREFFSNPVDPNQVSLQTTAAFRARRRLTRNLTIGGIVVLFVAILAGGAAVAYRYASEAGAFDSAEFEFPKITVDEIEGHWLVHSSTDLGVSLETPGPADFTYDEETGTTLLQSEARRLGIFRLYHRTGGDPHWNRLIPTINEKDARKFIPDYNHLTHKSHSWKTVGDEKVHHFRFAGKRPERNSPNLAASIHVFTDGEQTLALVWIGPAVRSNSKEVKYFLQQFRWNDVAYTE